MLPNSIYFTFDVNMSVLLDQQNNNNAKCIKSNDLLKIFSTTLENCIVLLPRDFEKMITKISIAGLYCVFAWVNAVVVYITVTQDTFSHFLAGNTFFSLIGDSTADSLVLVLG